MAKGRTKIKKQPKRVESESIVGDELDDDPSDDDDSSDDPRDAAALAAMSPAERRAERRRRRLERRAKAREIGGDIAVSTGEPTEVNTSGGLVFVGIILALLAAAVVVAFVTK